MTIHADNFLLTMQFIFELMRFFYSIANGLFILLRMIGSLICLSCFAICLNCCILVGNYMILYWSIFIKYRLTIVKIHQLWGFDTTLCDIYCDKKDEWDNQDYQLIFMYTVVINCKLKVKRLEWIIFEIFIARLFYFCFKKTLMNYNMFTQL